MLKLNNEWISNVVSTSNNFASKKGDLRRDIAIEGVIERDSEAMIAKPEIRYGVPLPRNVFRRWYASRGIVSGHGDECADPTPAWVEGMKFGGWKYWNGARRCRESAETKKEEWFYEGERWRVSCQHFWTSETKCRPGRFIRHVVACRKVKDLLVMSFDWSEPSDISTFRSQHADKSNYWCFNLGNLAPTPDVLIFRTAHPIFPPRAPLTHFRQFDG